VLRERIELSTSPLPRECSTTELPQRAGRSGNAKRKPLGRRVPATEGGAPQARTAVSRLVSPFGLRQTTPTCGRLCEAETYRHDPKRQIRRCSPVRSGRPAACGAAGKPQAAQGASQGSGAGIRARIAGKFGGRAVRADSSWAGPRQASRIRLPIPPDSAPTKETLTLGR
jgi:hypothetical protein